MADAPDGAVAVLGDQQRAVVSHRDADRPAPDVAVVEDEAGDEILVFAGRYPLPQTNANDLVTGPLRPVPRAVQGDDGIAAIVCGETGPVIERQAERRRVRLQQDIGDGDLVLEIGARAGKAGILVGADVEPGPAVERPLLYAGDIVGHQIIAEAIALVGRTPGRAVGRRNRKTNAVPD